MLLQNLKSRFKSLAQVLVSKDTCSKCMNRNVSAEKTVLFNLNNYIKNLRFLIE